MYWRCRGTVYNRLEICVMEYGEKEKENRGGKGERRKEREIVEAKVERDMKQNHR